MSSRRKGNAESNRQARSHPVLPRVPGASAGRMSTGHVKASARLLLEPTQFGGDYLPLTSELARAAERWLRSQLRHLPSEWPFEDRVLAWLVPDLSAQIEAFHRRGGHDMAGLLEQHQLAHLDRDIYRRLRLLVLRAVKRSS